MRCLLLWLAATGVFFKLFYYLSGVSYVLWTFECSASERGQKNYTYVAAGGCRVAAYLQHATTHVVYYVVHMKWAIRNHVKKYHPRRRTLHSYLLVRS